MSKQTVSKCFRGAFSKDSKMAIICSCVFRQCVSTGFRTGTELSLLLCVDSGWRHSLPFRELACAFLRSLFHLLHSCKAPATYRGSGLGLAPCCSVSLSLLSSPPVLENSLAVKWNGHGSNPPCQIASAPGQSDSTESIFPGLGEDWQPMFNFLGPT